MADFMHRYGKSLAFGVAIHLVAAVLLGFVSYRIQKTPPHIMEVTLAGGGGGGGAAPVSTPTETVTTATDKDAIVDKQLKKQEPVKQQVQPQPQVKTVAKATDQGGTGTGSGTGTGTGTGSGSGSGSGSGDGAGVGSGSGVGAPAVPPRLVSKTNPRYPFGPRSKNITGVTQVKMLVNEKGRVEDAFVAASSGNEELDDAAVECVKKWKFAAAKNKQGVAVQCYITIPIRFSIN